MRRMKGAAFRFFPAVILFLAFCPRQASGETASERVKIPPFAVAPATSEIRIDGVLDEGAWKTATVIPLPYEWQPGDNTPAPVKTDCLVTYTRRTLYFAFRALDPDPGQIRAHIMDRDAVDSFIQDDHVGLMIDPFNDERRAVQFRVNPLGVQMDAIFSEQDGIEDFSWDIIWDSAGRINSEGYVVEIGIPFNQLRFPAAQGEQTWGLEASRSWPRNVRHRMSSRWTDRNVRCVLCQENKITGLKGMSPGRNLEFDPTATSRRTESRMELPGGEWKSDGPNLDVGVTGRYGFTSSLTATGAVNPDFSQVEADVAQLDVNTRFALFFAEKRPFFLEGVDFFSTPFQAVFTRTVADPDWGAKLTGKEGKNAVGLFVTSDTINNLILPSNQHSDFASIDQHVTDSVLRYRRDLLQNSTLGFLYAGREAAGYHNRVYGLDGFNQVTDSDALQYQYLHSDTQYPTGFGYALVPGAFGGNAYWLRWDHNARNWSWRVHYDDVDRGFRADSGFMPRVDTRIAKGYFQRNFWPSAGTTWFTAGDIGFHYLRTEDHNGTLTDQEIQGYFDYAGPYQSSFYFGYFRVKSFFDGVTYDMNREEIFSQIKPSGSIWIQLYGLFGGDIDYDNSRPADGILLQPIVEVKLGPRVDLNFNHTLQRLSVEGGRLFTANLSQFRILYHFSVRTFARAILQYTDVDRNGGLYTLPVEPRDKHLFTQFLFSYKVNPRTVLFLGYSDNHAGTGRYDLQQYNRTVFLKVGYALVF
jgi:hypothetical protein